MTWSSILGTGSYLPERVVGNEELARRVDTSDGVPLCSHVPLVNDPDS